MKSICHITYKLTLKPFNNVTSSSSGRVQKTYINYKTKMGLKWSDPLKLDNK